MVPVRISVAAYRALQRLYGKQLTRSILIPNPRSSLDWPSSAGVGKKQVNWQRQRIPVYSIPEMTDYVTIDARRLNFRFQHDDLVKGPSKFVSIRPPRSSRYGARPPIAEVIIRNQNKKRDESTRRRRDAKPNWGGYRRIYSLSHKLISRPSEYIEFADTVQRNLPYGPASVASALALNEAVDYAYGARARALKKHVYRSGYWPFPVGYDTLRTLSGRIL